MKEIAIAIVFAVAGWMLRTWLTHQERMKELSMARQDVGPSAQRLARVEQAVESIASEVARISEGQRDVSMLLAERAQPAQPVLEGAAGAVRRIDTPR